MKGITRGYLKYSPLDAFTLAMIVHMSFNNRRAPIMGNPIIIKHKGTARTIYNRIDR